MKLKILLLPFAALALCANAFAVPPSDASLEKWLNTQHNEQDIEIILNEIFQEGFKPLSDTLVAEVSKEKKGEVEKAVVRYRDIVVKEAFTPELKQTIRSRLLKSAKASLTQKDVNAMIVNPSGKAAESFLDKNMGGLEELLPKKLQEAADRHKPEFIKEWRRIACGGKNPEPVCAKSDSSNKR